MIHFNLAYINQSKQLTPLSVADVLCNEQKENWKKFIEKKITWLKYSHGQFYSPKCYLDIQYPKL